MVTGILLGVASVSALIVFTQEHLLVGVEYVLGVLITILCFAAMQRTVSAIYGLNYKSVAANVKKKSGKSL